MRCKLHIFLPAFVLITSINQAQISQTNRVEFNLIESEQGFKVIPVGEEGIFMYRELIINTNFILEVRQLDTNLNQVWNGFIPIDNKLEISDYDIYENNIAILLKPRGYYAAQMLIIYIKSKDGSYVTYDVTNPLPIFQSGFKITSYAALIGGYFSNRPLVYYYEFANQQSRILPGFLNEPGEINQIQTYADNSFEVLINSRHFDKKKVLWVKHFSASGNLLRNEILRTDNRMNLLFGRSIIVSDTHQIIAGVYGRQNYEFSHGIFTSSSNSGAMHELNYYNYADLDNFFNYMKAKRRERVKERVTRRKIKGKKIRLSYRLLVHEIIEDEDQYILLGQAFYPRYRSENINLVYGNPYGSNLIFDGYKYTHAIILGLDKKGKIIWDNSFETNEIHTFQLNQFVKTYKDEDNSQLVLLYLFDNVIRSKVIQRNKVVEGKNFDPIQLRFSNDAVVRSNSSKIGGLEHWYDRHFIAYGIQTIRNENVRGSSTRRVFYINKINYN